MIKTSHYLKEKELKVMIKQEMDNILSFILYFCN